MIGQLLMTLVIVLAMLLTNMNLLGALPLVLVPLSALVRSRWLGLAGLLIFCSVTLGNAKGLELTDLPRFGAVTAALVVPSVILLELILSDRTARSEKVSIWPILVVTGVTAALIATLFFLTRVQGIGVYLGSDPTLQVFILMSLSILYSGPILLGTGNNGRPGAEKGLKSPPKGQTINKNE
ncbi:MAG: hypothetical protein MUC62_01255 [Candidatus Thermoplasmatota archaeon]|jgi:hypothetical protein|nr:hypothetical protein [Candidatus Thermoplasmatota archaeon]